MTTAYCVMALPLVVAITQIVVDAGAMTSQDASVLVTAGAITVLVVPVLTSLVRVTAPAPNRPRPEQHRLGRVRERKRGP